MIFLYNRDAAYIEEIVTALRDLDLDIRRVEASSDLISNLVPNALQRGAESWLIFFPPDRQQELLILPFPDENQLHRHNNALYFRGYLADLIPTLRQCLTDDPPYVPPDWIERFQYIRHDSSLDALLRKSSDMDRARSDVQIQSTLLRTSQNIGQQRHEVLGKVLRTRDSVLIDSLVNELDEVFAMESDKIFEYLQNTHGSVEVVPPIVTDFQDIIDDETKRFLITSETVKKFADSYSPGNFDYSAPGCGLWKAVERELNLSLVLYVRQQRRIVNINNPWQGIIDPRRQIQIQTGDDFWVNLNKREQKNRDILSGLMLGRMTHMLRWGNTNGIRRDLKNLSLSGDMLSYLLGTDYPTGNIPPLTPNTLPWHLQELGKLRNSYAHASAMSREQFKELRDLVLPSDSESETCLVKILHLKRKVYEKFGLYPISIRSIFESIN